MTLCRCVTKPLSSFTIQFGSFCVVLLADKKINRQTDGSVNRASPQHLAWQRNPKRETFLGISVWSLQYFGRWIRRLSHRRDVCCTKHTETHYMIVTRDLCKVYLFVCPSIHKAVSAEMAQHFCLSSCSASP